jgi:hypothetical protein
MSESPKTITRDELYQKVWKTSFVKLAKELGYSYPELVGICADLEIPRPTGGYWYRLAQGGAVEQLPLPPAPQGTRTNVALGTRQTMDDKVEKNLDQPSTVVDSEALGSGPDKSTLEGTPSEIYIAAVKSPVKKQPEAREQSRLNTPPIFPNIVAFDRKQLYDHVWSTPCQQLSKALGVSDVALAKTCKRMGIPLPSRGYWARLEAGETLEKMPLPPAAQGEERVVTFDIAANVARRAQWAIDNVITAGKGDKPSRVELAIDGVQLHPIAEKHQRVLLKAKPDSAGFVQTKGKDLFSCEVSLAQVSRVVKAIHAIVCEFERRNYSWAAGVNEHCGLQVVKGNDQIKLHWQEARVEVEREPTAQEKRKPSWTWQLKEIKPTGELGLEVSAINLRGRRKWTEGERWPLEMVLGCVTEKVEATFRGFEEQRQRQAERAKQQLEEDKRRTERRAHEIEMERQKELERKEREQIRRHEAKLEEIAKARRDNLSVATKQWIEAQGMKAFVEFCEYQWRQSGAGGLSKVQSDWLEWARSETDKKGPFAKGYPDPVVDGKLDVKSIPVGGPYPELSILETALPKAPAPPTPEVKTVYVEHSAPPEQFPFWLLHRGKR